MSINPYRRHPNRASQVRAVATGEHPPVGGSIAVRHPVNQVADEHGSSPPAAKRCLLQFWST